MRKRLYTGLIGIPVLLVAAIGFLAGPGSADPNLPNVPAHRHWQGDPANGVQIGPRLCDNPKLQKAFNQFHFNIHHSFIPPAAGGQGQYDTNGPQDRVSRADQRPRRRDQIHARLCSAVGGL